MVQLPVQVQSPGRAFFSGAGTSAAGTWKDKAKRGANLQLGVIAQEIEKVFPEAVLTDAQGSKSVLYTALIAPVIKAIKELYTKSQGYEAKISKLEAQNRALEARLERLEKK